MGGGRRPAAGGRDRSEPPLDAIGAPLALVEPERGPLAQVFRAWDKLTEPAAKVGRALEARISKYHGVSEEAEQALRAWGGRREFTALTENRMATRLYKLAKAEWGTKAGALPHLEKIEHAIEQPGAIALDAGEQKVARAVEDVRDAATLLDVSSGLLTPEALRGAERLAPQMLAPAKRETLEQALGAWRELLDGFGVRGQAELQAELRRAKPDERAEINAGLNRLPPDARRLVLDWIERAVPGTAEPYFPHEYLPERRSYMNRSGGPRGLAPAHKNVKRRTFPTLQEAEAAGFQPDPDAIGVITRRFGRALRASSNRDLLRDLGRLGGDEFHAQAPHGHYGEPVPSEGFRLASETPLAGKRKAEIMGAPEPEVSEKLARAVEEIAGPRDERGKLARIGQSAWAIQRALNFWNFLKHSYNVAALAAERGAVEGTRALATGRFRAAGQEFMTGLGPLSFLLDPEVLRQSLKREGPLFDRAVKAGAVRARLGRAAQFGIEVATPDDAVQRASDAVWGRTGAGKLGHAAQTVVGAPHWFTFDFLDAGIRLQMFKRLVAQGLSDREAAKEVNDWLVDYGALRRGKGVQPMSRVLYTAPYMAGAAKASAVAWRRNPLAALLMYGVVYGAPLLGIAGYEGERNREQTGRGMAANPPGSPRLAEVSPRGRRLATAFLGGHESRSGAGGQPERAGHGRVGGAARGRSAADGVWRGFRR